MENQPQGQKGSSPDYDIDRLRKQLSVLKGYLVSEPSGEALVGFDSDSVDMISGLLGSSSPMIEAYEYATMGEAAGLINLPEEAPEGGTHQAERETLRQRQRVLESCLSDLETRRAAAAQRPRTKNISGPRVLEFMSKGTRSISMEATLKEAGKLLLEWKVGALLVQSGDEFVGSISEKELALEVVGKGMDATTTTVKTCMREPLVTIESSDPIVEAVQIMKDQMTRHLAVMESDRVVGVVSVSDVLRYYSGVV
jgi:signal-transduction protein with cAMP-binding, CBS, and nucleotidyltransferase domain